MTFKDNFRKERAKTKLSQEKIAEKLGVSRQTISKWENGNAYPSTKHIFRLVEIFGCSLDDLIKNQIEKEPENPSEVKIKTGLFEKNCWLVGAVAVVFMVIFGIFVCLTTIYFCEKSDGNFYECKEAR